MSRVQPIRDINMVEKMEAYLKRQSLRNWMMFVTGINTGLRISDILPLQVKDVRNKTFLTIQERKTKKWKTVRLTPKLILAFDEYTAGMDDEDYLFPSQKTGRPISRIQAYRILRQAAEVLGIEYCATHTMRKTFGYHFYQQYKDVATLQEIFNHSSPSITLRYIGINQNTINAMMENFALGAVDSPKR